MKHTLTVLTTLLLASLAASAVDLKVASVFSDQTILQRDKPVPVWGSAEVKAKITVEFGGQKKDVLTDVDGKWLVKLEAMPASAEPRELRVFQAPDATPVIIKDVLVGDVFLCAGGAVAGKRDNDADSTPPDEKTAPVRVFNVTPGTAREVQSEVKGRWAAVSKTSPVKSVYLGRALAAETGVPVGIIRVAMGYPVESWMSREALAATPEAAPILTYYAGDAWKLRTVGTYEERVKAWTEYCQKLPLNPPPKPKPDDVDTLAKQEPSGVWNFSIAPLAPLALRAVVWDGGEDWGSQSRAFQQGQLLPAMIADWRTAFVVRLQSHAPAHRRGGVGRALSQRFDRAAKAGRRDPPRHLRTRHGLRAKWCGENRSRDLDRLTRRRRPARAVGDGAR